MTELGALQAVLEDARRLGFLGPDPVERHIGHTRAWASVLTPAAFLDLGSGGGVPGIVLAVAWPQVDAVLVESQTRRTGWLRVAIGRLGLSDRVRVVEGRAEELGRGPDLREQHDLVVARSFGPPALTAECGSAFVAVGGVLSVSEPPDALPGRWPEQELASLGLDPARQVVHEGASFVILPKQSPLREEFPRLRHRPLRSPLW